MRKFYVLSLVLLGFIGSLSARKIEPTEALNIAKTYFSQSKSQAMRVKSQQTYKLVYQGLDTQNAVPSASNQSYFYVYNIGNNNGFIIVSADTRVKSILGYAREGAFDVDALQSNTKYWLENYTREIKYAVENLPDTEASAQTAISKVVSANVLVQPLLGNIRYDQGSPYNDLCPIVNGTRTATGCVATAMAQVMSYHQYPVQGVGSKTYKTTSYGLELSVDFGATTYDWANIVPAYNASSTTEQKEAIATLVYHAGVGANMDYRPGESGAQLVDAARALYNNFGYDAGIQYFRREYFAEADWIAKLKTELDASRPVLYGGYNSSSGHAFVFDGYDENNLFHINWGWSGMSNGYYEISALTPGQQGIGGSNGGFNQGQDMITGIQKPVDGSKITQVISMDNLAVSETSIPRSGSVKFTAQSVFNYGAFNYPNGRLVLRLIKDGKFVRQLRQQNAYQNPWISFTGFHYELNNVSIPLDIANGTYEVELLYTNENGVNVPVLTSYKGARKITAEITSTTINFTPQTLAPQIELTASPTASGNIYQNKIANIDVNLANNGNGEYSAQIGLKLVKKDDETVFYSIANEQVHFNPGETKTLSFTKNIPAEPGEYYLKIFADGANDQYNTKFPNTQVLPVEFVPVITVMPTPPAYVLNVQDKTIPGEVTIGEDFTVSATIKNTGGYFGGNVQATILKVTGQYATSVASFGNQMLMIDNSIVKTLDFNGNISNLEAGNYLLAFYNLDGSWKRFSDLYNFKLVNPVPTSVHSSATNYVLSYIQTPGKLKLQLPENAKFIQLFDLKGTLVYATDLVGEKSLEMDVSGLNLGVYILRLKTTTDDLRQKVIIR